MTKKRTRGKIETIAVAVEEAREQLIWLAKKAEHGDWLAGLELLRLTNLGVDCLTLLYHCHPELIRDLAKNRTKWPVKYSLHPELARKADAFLRDDLKLGGESGINVSGRGKSFSWETPAAIIAIYLHKLACVFQFYVGTRLECEKDFDLRRIARNVKSGALNIQIVEKQLRALIAWAEQGPGSQLSPLTKKTAVQWGKAMAPVFRIIFGDEFENDPRLKGLKTSIAGTRFGEDGRARSPAVVRSLMLKAFTQAFKSIAAGSDK